MFRYDKNVKRVTLAGSPDNIGVIKFNETLGRMLGCGGEYVCPLNVDRKTFPYMCNVFNSVPKYIYVYCNIIENQIVGGGKYPLLRRVNIGDSVHDDRDSTISRIYDRIFYVPLKSKEFNTIQITIRQDGSGDFAPFGSGIVSATLHFLKQK